MTKNAMTVEVYTADTTWAAKYGTPVEDRTAVAGCTETGRYTFCGREWVNYRLPIGVKPPKDWDKVAVGALAAPAQWVHVEH